jgi:hypothetical protein
MAILRRLPADGGSAFVERGFIGLDREFFPGMNCSRSDKLAKMDKASRMNNIFIKPAR